MNCIFVANLKFDNILYMKLIRYILGAFIALSFAASHGQESKKRVDGVVAVLGDHFILESDIDKGFVEAKSTGLDTSRLTRCEILGSLLESKLFMHHAVEDSITVDKATIAAELEAHLDQIIERTGSVENALKLHRRKSLDELKEDLETLLKNNHLASSMQEKIVSKVQITPQEVSEFFNGIKKEELPTIGKQVELSEIVSTPQISQEQKQAVIDQLKKIRSEVVDNGDSFVSKVYMYSEDTNSLSTGGFFPVTKKSNFVKEFKDVAFSLKEGEVSQPFETQFGYHIIFLEKIKGNTLEVRHILISAKPTDEAIAKAKEKLENVLKEIQDKTITFEQAVAKYSDKKENKFSGGLMVNQETGETQFEVNRISDRFLYNAVSGLNVGELSKVDLVIDPRNGGKFYRLVKVISQTPEHQADYNKDYIKIKDIALRDKKGKEIAKWVAQKISQTYVFIHKDYQNCVFKVKWLQSKL